jgi:predicted GH43/DUF377 family glycosyl hydrolase
MLRVFFFLLVITSMNADAQVKKNRSSEVAGIEMEKVYEEVKTPFKYGIVLSAPDSTKMADSPTIFRLNEKWYMTYIIFDGTGYETWLAESDDLLHWATKGKTMSFTDNTWDANQKAGYVSLVNTDWGGDYKPMKFENKYWISYLGGSVAGYEAGRLGIGMAYTNAIDSAGELTRISNPVLSSHDSNSRWFEKKTIFKSNVIYDKTKQTGYPFVMYYNAAGDSSFESIGMAASNDMVNWKRLGKNPILTKHRGICGDAQIVKMGKLYVLFFFGFNWKDGESVAFDRFACSYDLQNWTEWKGPNLVEPSEPYDQQYAHKPWIVKWKGVVYHFYNAVGSKGRVIALATSKDLKSVKP